MNTSCVINIVGPFIFTPGCPPFVNSTPAALELAWRIIAAPVPLGFMMAQKLAVLTHYMAV